MRTRRVRLVRGVGRGVSDQYGGGGVRTTSLRYSLSGKKVSMYLRGRPPPRDTAGRASLPGDEAAGPSETAIALIH